MDYLLESLELDGRANGRGDWGLGIQATTMTIALKAEGALVGREFLFQLFLYQRFNRIGTACTGLQGSFDNLTGNHRLNRIGMASTLQGPSER